MSGNHRAGQAIAVAGLTALLTTGCLGDPPPDPAIAPLEVIIDGCLLNRPDVGDGTHDVSVVGSGEVRITDESGTEVLTLEGGDQGRLTTTSQTYTVTCTTADAEQSATLESTAG